ncbi:hypothetical protein UT300019_03190 [Clostridium sp. CTA-19]
MNNQKVVLFVHKCDNCGWEFIANTTVNICPECDVEMINPVKDELTSIINWEIE